MAICCGGTGQLPEHKDHVGKGWADIIDELHENLLGIDPEYTVDQVKEKFGWLRVYITSCSAAAYPLVHVYEEKSSHTCEWCGNPGHTRTDGWMRTLCDSCEEKRKTGYRPWLEEIAPEGSEKPVEALESSP